MKKYCLALDLKNDPAAIAAYDRYHLYVWNEIEQHLFDVGIINMEIYRIENRLFMIIETNESFSFKNKTIMDKENAKVQEWETLMSNYQQVLPGTQPGEKWRLMDCVYKLHKE